MKELLTDPNAWNAIADGYSDTARRTLTPFSVKAVQWADIRDNDDVLDVASGPGTTTILAAQQARTVQAVDFAPQMIANLQKNTADFTNISAMVGDGQKLTFEDARFTAAFSMFGLMFFPDPIAGLRELHRVLKPQGRVIISSWPPLERSPAMKPMIDAMMHVLPPQPDQPPPEPFHFEDEQSLKEGLEEGGFEDVEVQAFTSIKPVVSVEHYWADTRGNIFVNHIRKMAGDQWPALEVKILAHLQESLRGVKELSMTALIAKGWKW